MDCIPKYRPGKCSYGKESHGITIAQGAMRVHICSERLFVVGLGSDNIVISTIRLEMINTYITYLSWIKTIGTHSNLTLGT